MTGNLDRLVPEARKWVESGQMGPAYVIYKEIFRITTPPRTGVDRIAHGEACHFFAKDALRRNRIGEAGDWLREAIDVDPMCSDYRVDMALKVLLPIGLKDSARGEAVRATQVEPDSLRAWRALGGIEHELGDVARSRVARRTALGLAPEDPNVIIDAVTLTIDTADYDLAEHYLRLLARVAPDRRGDALHSRGMILYRQGRHREAIEAYTAAIEAGVEDPEMVRWNRSLPLHSIGAYEEGWADYECRGTQRTAPLMATALRRFTLPVWRGEGPEVGDEGGSPAPLRLHLHEEMGYGDSLALARYVPVLLERGYDVRLEVREELLELFKRSFPTVKITPKAIDYPRSLHLEPFDCHCPLLSLPHAVGMTVENVHWSGPYLRPDPDDVARNRDRLGAGRKVGVCWSSGVRDGTWLKEYGLRKSMAFGQLAPLFSTDATFVSLQTGPEALQNSIIPAPLPADPTWDDTAALVGALDLVVTVDTAVAHLAGAMGVPTWLMMHTEGSWHWMVERTDSPWYPSVKLYRQERAHEWTDVVGRVAQDLR